MAVLNAIVSAGGSNAVVTNLFFELVRQYLAGQVSVVIEAAFQHAVWEAKMPMIRQMSNPYLVIRSVDAEVAASRHLERGLSDSRREFYHGDRRVSIYRATGEMAPAGEYVEPDFDVPTIRASTERDCSPGVDKIVRMIQA